MSPFSKMARSRLSEQFAEIYQMSQDEYRELLIALRDDRIDLEEFTSRVDMMAERLVKLKRIRVQLSIEREELDRFD